MLRRRSPSKTALIRQVPLFSKLSAAKLKQVASVADEIDLPPGKDLTREGQTGREFFVLIDGAAEVRKNGRRVNRLGAGDFLGEISLLTKQPRTATVTTTEPTRALVITSRAFAQLLHDSPDVASGILDAVGQRLAGSLS